MTRDRPNRPDVGSDPEPASPAPGRSAPPDPGSIRYHFLRLAVTALARGYVRVRLEGIDNLPEKGGFVLCFNHPSWADPFVMVGCWPTGRQRIFVLGPREMDMSRGMRNRLIAWSRRSLPFKPDGSDMVDLTRRAVALLRRGDCLAVAGEGRLSDREDDVVPLQAGVAHMALMAGVPVVPVALIGTRWLHFRALVRMRFGRPIQTSDLGRGREAALRLTAAIEHSLRQMLAGVEEGRPPGPVGRWISELFNDRPWLEDGDR